MYIIGYPLLALVTITSNILFLYSIVVLVSVIAQWLKADPHHPVIRVINMMTVPVFAYVRRYAKPIGQVDIAPLVVLLAIMFIQQGILPIFARLASNLMG